MQDNRRSFNAGDVVCTSKPYVHVLMHQERDVRCEECLRSNITLKKCAQCGVSKYCSRVCQKNAWTYHKDECHGFLRIAPKIPKDSTLLLFRLIRKSKSEKGKKETEEILGQMRTFFDLESHAEETKTDAKKYADFLQICQSVTVFAGDGFALGTRDEILAIFGKMSVNTFSICDGEMQPIGAGLYLGPSVFDHSCSPNACVVFNGVNLTAMCTQYIQSGESITISYIDLLRTTEERRLDLESAYYFRCVCVLCQDIDRDQLMYSTRCPTVSCHNRVLYRADNNPLPCSGCGVDRFDDSYSRAKNDIETKCTLVMQRAKKLKEKENHEIGDILASCEDCLTDSILDPLFNIYKVRVLEVAFDVCIDSSQWERALGYAQRLIEPYRRYFPTFHPTVGVNMMKLGKIQLFLQLLPEAYESLSQAASILSVTHGKQHPLYADLEQLISQCREEMNERHDIRRAVSNERYQ